MKLICSKSNLLHGVNIVSKAVPTRTTMAILECILIDASANEIKLTANDMELGIETKIEGEIAERGVIALDAKIFSEIVRKLPDSDVTIETDASFKTTITCEKAKFNIVGKSGDDFSYIPYIERNEPIVMSQFTLKEVIRQTIFSIADNDNNKLMTGELFEIEENDLKVVSLDGHRISIRNIELKNNYSHKKVVVPGKTLQEVCKILPGSAVPGQSRYRQPPFFARLFPSAKSAPHPRNSPPDHAWCRSSGEIPPQSTFRPDSQFGPDGHSRSNLHIAGSLWESGLAGFQGEQ